jgi:3-dehydroquinate synthase
MKIFRQRFRVAYTYPTIFTNDVFGERNAALRAVLSGTGRKPNRILTVIDSGVFNATVGLLEKMENHAAAQGGLIELVSYPYIMKGGEDCKKDPEEIKRVTELINRHHLCRHSFVLAIGGGAVLDAVGFAAAIAHRGIRLIRMPTTTLAQQDAGVGVKNGINAFGRKNFMGTFAAPFAVINDFDFLTTLPERHLRAGLAEAVKVSLIKDGKFFDYLYESRARLAAFDPAIMEKVIERCARLHLQHIGHSGDPFEFGSSRPLDFGHWTGHKLEEMTNGVLNHGEAVAIGMALDVLYSRRTGLRATDGEKVLRVLEDLGFRLFHPALQRMNIEKALGDFQEHLGGRLTIPLLKSIGEKIDVNEIRTGLVKRYIETLASRERKKEMKNGRAK